MKKKSVVPKNAKKAFQGVVYDVYQWKQKLFDGSFAIFEKVKRPDAVTIIAIVGDKILIQKQAQPFKGKFLSLPGGRIDPGEKPLQAAKREFLEETGYVSKNSSLWEVFSPASGMFFSEYTYIFRDCQKIQEQKLDAGEQIKCELVSFEKFLKLSDLDAFRHRSLTVLLLRMRLNSNLKAEFKKLLFKK